jgi:tetratricopeptide (TPR) repeat protein
MGVMNGITVQPSIADAEIRKSMQLLSTALNEHIKKCRSSSDDDKTKVMFHQVVDLMLADWSAFFLPPKHLKYKKVFRRALGIQPQLAQFDEESFDIDRHQHDLECLARIALSIKRNDVEEEIRKWLPYQPQINNPTLNNETKIKDGWVKLKDEGKYLIEKKEWAQAMFRFSQAIYLNSEEGSLYCYRAMCEIRLSKFQLAIEDAEDAIDLNPKCSEFQNTLSKAHLGLRSPQIKVATKSPKTVLQENHKCEEAFPVLQRAAENGLAEAQYRLGRMLIYGDGCPRNELAAKKWLLRARDQGFKPKALRTEKWVDDMMRHAKCLIQFESENKIKINGLSLVKRIERFSFFTHFKFDSIDELLESAITFETRLPAKQSNSIMKPVVEEWMPLMIERAKTRSLKAQSFFVAHELIIKAKKLLIQNQTVESFKMLREGTGIEPVQFPNY